MPILLQDTLDEIHVLALFNPASTLEGIKVHGDAHPAHAAATRRLHEKGLITQADGGYLTTLGQDALRHLDLLVTILTPVDEQDLPA